MNRSSIRTWLLFLVTFSLASTVQSAEPMEGKGTAKGQFLGSMTTVYPDWFKESFLELESDAAEAGERNKHVMVLFHQDGCPYCNVLVERNLSQKHIEDYARQHFDVVAINMWGDREVLAVGGKQFTEKSFSSAMKVQFTPTLVFLDSSGKTVLRLNGYLPPDRFLAALTYVAEHRAQYPKYADYLASLTLPSAGEMNRQDFFRASSDFSKGLGSVQAAFFEQAHCPNCDNLHQNVLSDPTTRKMVSRASSSQLDMWSDTPVVTPDGTQTTARQWARELDVKYAPTIVLFDKDGNEVIRSEAFFKTFHTEGIFDYVISGAYLTEPSFQRWLNEKAEHLREQGKDVDIWK